MMLSRIGGSSMPLPLNDAHFATIDEAARAGVAWIARARAAGSKHLVLFVDEQGEQGYLAVLIDRAIFNRLLRHNPSLYSPQWRARLRDLEGSTDAIGVVRVGQTPISYFRIPLEAKGPELVWLLADAISGEGAVS